MRRLCTLTALLLLTAWAPAIPGQAPPSAPPSLRVHFVDVGEGDAVLIQTPTGQNVVYDAGESPTRMREYLASVGVTQVDLVIASHNHADHIGGLAEVLALRPRYYLDNGIPAATAVYQQVVAAAGSQRLELTAGRIALGDVSLAIVPPPGLAAWDQNDNSIGVIVEYGAFRLSLAGDAEPRQWAWWTTQQPEWLLPVHLHKASNHGSIHGDTAAALAGLSPEVVVVSAGQGNRFGHPDPEALRLYAEHGARVYRTDLNGSIVIDAAPTGAYTVRAERGDETQPPPPSPPPVPAPTPAPAPMPAPTPPPISPLCVGNGGFKAGSMSASIDGVEWVAGCISASVSTLWLEATGIRLPPSAAGNFGFRLLVPGGIRPGTYGLGDNLSGTVQDATGTALAFPANIGGKGPLTLTITELTATGASGTFSFDAIGASGTRVLRGGTFSIVF